MWTFYILYSPSADSYYMGSQAVILYKCCEDITGTQRKRGDYLTEITEAT